MMPGIIPRWLIGARAENHGLNLRGNFVWATRRPHAAARLEQCCSQLNSTNKELKTLRLK
jgi:hypothetical protein